MKTKEHKFVTVQAIVDAPLEIVWKLWTTPEDIIRWNNASDDWHTTNAENDLKTGGRFKSRMEARDRSSGFDFEGVYDNVILHKRIEYTMGDGRKVNIAFSRSDNKTSIVETFEPEELNSIELQHGGWQAILDNFKRYAEEKSTLRKGPSRLTHQITPSLWFENKAEEAAEFYVSVFSNSKILNKSYYTKAGFEFHGQNEGTLMAVDFEINGQHFNAINGGPVFRFNEAISFQVFCQTQGEIDYYWDKLTAGGEEVQCGWLKDKYGVSWQVVPSLLPDLLSDPARAERVTAAFMQMKKMDIKKLKEA